MQPEQYFDAYFSLMESGELLRDLVERQLKEDADLSYVQFRILAILSEAKGGELRMTQLADAIVHSRSGVTYQAKLLEERGLIRRAVADVDTRGVTVTLTDSGTRALEGVVPDHISLVFDTLFANLSDSDVEAMTEVLTRVRAILRSKPPRSKR